MMPSGERKNRLIWEVILLFLSSLFLPYKSISQNNNYWSYNFNTTSALLSGAVVGGEADVSSIYYNPALISRVKESQVALNASLFTVEWFTYENAFGEGLDVDKLDLIIQPRFFSITADLKNRSKLEVAYFTRASSNQSILFEYNQQLDILTGQDGIENYRGEVKLSHDYSERWFGVGYSKNYESGLALGISMFGIYKSLNYEFNKSMRAFGLSDSITLDGVPAQNYIAAAEEKSSLKPWNGRLLWKGGIHYKKGQWGVGMAITTPSINVMGSSKLNREVSRISVQNPFTLEVVADSSVLNNETGQGVNMKDPFSVAVGAEFNNRASLNKIALTIEYFANIETYDLIDSDHENIVATEESKEVIYSNPDIDTFLYGANSVLNVGIGYKYFVNDNIYAMGGFRTDFNNVKGLENSGSSFLERDNVFFDLYHVTAGGEFTIRQFEFVAGFEYTWGREENLEQVINFSDPIEFVPVNRLALQGMKENIMKASYNSLSFFLGLTFNILGKRGSS